MVAGVEAGRRRRWLQAEQALTTRRVQARHTPRSPAAAAAFFACLVLLVSCSGRGPRPSSATTEVPPTSAATTTTTTTPPRTDVADPYSWTLDAIPHLGGGVGATLSAVLAPGASNSWIVAGTRIAGSGATTATVWTSPDGNSWTAANLSSTGTPTGAPSGVASSTAAYAASQWRDTTVIVGSLTTASGSRATAWVSDGLGQPYRPAEIQSSGADSQMHMVTAGPLGLFAIGTVDGSFAMWSSTDGAVWTESLAAEKTIDASPSAQVNSLLAEGDSVYAAGSVRDGTSTDAAVWSSSDGIAWKQVINNRPAFSGAGGDRVIESLAPLQTGLVAVGAQRVGDRYEPASWISPDGVSWSSPSSDFSPRPGQAVDRGDDAVARSVSSCLSPSGSTALISVGGTGQSQRVWRSTDGIHWDAVALPAGAAASAGWRATVVATGVDSALVGDSDWGQPHLLTLTGTEWTEPSVDPKTFGPVQPFADATSTTTSGAEIIIAVDVTQDPQALGGSAAVAHYSVIPESASPAGETSGEGATSTAVSATRSPAQVPAGTTSVTRWDSGWLAVGSTPSGSAVAWISTDGLTWTADTLLAAAAGQVAVPLGACSNSSVAVAVGTSIPAGVLIQRSGSRGVSASAPTTSIPASAFTPRRAVAWSGPSAKTMRTATLTSVAGGPGDEGMVGCVSQSSGFVAFGATSTASGGLVPAIWRSPRGRSWIRQPSNGFTGDSTGALDSLAVHGATSLAVAGTASVTSLSDRSDPGLRRRAACPRVFGSRQRQAGHGCSSIRRTGAGLATAQPT